MKMNHDRIEQLADEIAAEISWNITGFGIEYVEKVKDALRITFSWEQQPYYLEITINPCDHNTDESVRDEMRRLLSAAGLRLTVPH